MNAHLFNGVEASFLTVYGDVDLAVRLIEGHAIVPTATGQHEPQLVTSRYENVRAVQLPGMVEHILDHSHQVFLRELRFEVD